MNSPRLFPVSVLLIVFLFVFNAPVLFAADTLYVGPGGNCPGGSPCGETIQHGIDLSDFDLTIDICPGTYIETLLFPSEGAFRKRTFDCGGTVVVDGSLSIQNGVVNLNSGALVLQNQGLVPVSVPDVVGMEKNAAQSTLIAADLILGSEANRGSDTVAVDHVISQSPAAGAVMAPGMPVDMIISVGSYAGGMPDVIGMSQSEAQDTLSDAGLILGETTEQYSETVPIGLVINQNPLPQAPIVWEDPVNLLVSLGPSGSPPPDPATEAPEIDRTVSTTMIAACEFLFTGQDPVQKAVVTGTVEPKRVAVLRGKVSDRLGAPLSEVTVTILNHPEYGHTLTRDDGMFDLAVNGGRYLTVDYQKSGYLPVQRQIDVPWQDYVRLPEIVMIPLDSQVTVVDLTSPEPMQVAEGSVVTDDDGTRRAVLMIPQGTTAEITLPDGTPQSINSLSLRATEYTVGDNGPGAMPAELPPTSGYTYAVELSADEALTNGIKVNGKDVVFNQPVPFYVDNFLDFPVGTIVPTGYYDNDKGAWIPYDNGLVIEIIGVAGGLADVDVDGDGVADMGTALSDLGITVAEREQLGILYAPGNSLWRVRLGHLSTWDCNWGFGPPDDAGQPPAPDPGPEPPDDTCQDVGSIIECQSQVLGERIPIVGTPMTLNYRSDRVPGRLDHRTLSIPLSGETVPISLLGIKLEVTVAGQRFTQSFPPSPNQSYTFRWDGRDAYGRTLQGGQQAKIRTGFTYSGVYQETERFGYNGNGIPITGSQSRQVLTLWQEWQETVSLWDARNLGLGGWSLDVHHAYDPGKKRLYLGDGSKRGAKAIDPINTVAGTGMEGFTGDGGPATEAQLGYPIGVAAGADGSLYIADSFNHRIRKVDPNSIITTVAGNTIPYYGGFSGDGGPATEAALNNPFDVAVGSDGSLYIADLNNNRIRHVAPDGIISTVAGDGEFCSPTTDPCGDGGPATQSQLAAPAGVAVGPDGSLYIHTSGRIRRVAPDGIIDTVAGTGRGGFSGDGGPATEARISWELRGFAFGQDGSLYFSDTGNNRIRRVTPNGIIDTVAGNGNTGYTGDGGFATEARLNSPWGLDIGLDGSLFIADMYNYRIRRVSPNGIITTLAGTGEWSYFGDLGPATRAGMFPVDLVIGLDGGVYIADGPNCRVRAVKQPFTGFTAVEFVIPSVDDGEVYLFDTFGRHLETRNSLTGSLLYDFSYDEKGRLLEVVDRFANVTTIERAMNDNPTGITAPEGQTTILTLDPDGYLERITNPASEQIVLTYADQGLLATFTDARGNAAQFIYDELGRLIQSEDPAGGVKPLARTEIERGFEVAVITPLGRITTYGVESLPGGEQLQVNTFPNGTQSQKLIEIDGSETMTETDNTVMTRMLGPDPRFGMLAPILESFTTTTPSGLTSVSSSSKQVTLSDPDDVSSLEHQTVSFTQNGRTFLETFDTATGTAISTTPEGRQRTTTLDGLGSVVEIAEFGLLPSVFAYDSQGRLLSMIRGSDADKRTTMIEYDANGQLSMITDPEQRTRAFDYDDAGRRLQTIRADGSEIHYGYDANGNLNSLMPPTRPTHAFEYTPLNLEATYTAPDIGTASSSTLYEYNLDRQLTRILRPDGAGIDLIYDTTGRLVERRLPDRTLTYTYDATTGRPAGIAGSDGQALTFTYDGFLMTESQWTGAVNGRVAHTYDANFSVATESVNGAHTAAFTRDNDSLLTSAGALTVTRDAQTGAAVGSNLDNIDTTVVWNNFAEIVQFDAAHAGTDLLSITYTKDKLSRITQKTETINGVTTTYDYAYDPAGRLTQVTEDGTPVTTYTYDANGNRLSVQTSIGTRAATFDDQDRLLTHGDFTYVYTDNGELLSQTNTVSGDVTGYTYDVLGNLQSVTLPDSTQIEYVVDGLNRRVGKKVDGILIQAFLYRDRLNPVVELDAAGSVVSRFIYGTHLNVPEYMERDGKTYRFVVDYLSSPRLIVDTATGVIAQHLDYDPFGQITLDTNPGFQPFAFAGGIYDPQTGLVRFGARDYDPAVGRWTAKDPIRFEGGTTNLYEYAMNDPVNRLDTMGLSCIDNCLERFEEIVGRGDIYDPETFEPGDAWTQMQYDNKDCLTFYQECLDESGDTGDGFLDCEREMHTCQIHAINEGRALEREARDALRECLASCEAECE